MWDLWTRSKNFSQLPSTVFGEEDSLAAWMLDGAVKWFGMTIENALMERVEMKLGNGTTKSSPRYTLTRLLDSNTKLPLPVEMMRQQANPFSAFLQMAGKSGKMVRRFAYVPPKQGDENG